MTQSGVTTLGWAQSAPSGAPSLSVARVVGHSATGPHDHVFHEIVLIEAGAAEHHTVEGGRPLRPGDIILIRPLQWHAYRNPQQLTLINCLIGRRLMNRLALIMRSDERAFQLFTRPLRHPRETSPLVLHAPPAESRHCAALLEKVVLESRTHLTGWEPMVVGALLEFLALVMRVDGRACPPQKLEITDRAHKAVLDTAVWLEQNAMARESLAQLARRVYLSPTHLSRVFTRRMGIGVVAYRNRIRMEEACRLLAQTDLAVTQIAGRLGYDEIAFFSRLFRQFTGQSPRQYRQRHTPIRPSAG